MFTRKKPRKERRNTQMNEGRPCKIVLLNGQRLDIIVQTKLKTSDLLEITLSHFFVKQQQCFGLHTTCDTHCVCWLDPKKKVLEHEFIGREGPLILYLGVRFYLESTAMLTDLKAIELFYLQARNSFLKGLIVCDDSATMFALSALTLQFEHGDYTDKEYSSALKKTLPSLQSTRKDQLSTREFEEGVRQKYKGMAGMCKGKALVRYLKLVESQNSYGVHFYQVKDKRNTPHWLGISLRGISLFEYNNRRTAKRTFLWTGMENIFYQDKRFHFEERRDDKYGGRSKGSHASSGHLSHFSTTDVILHTYSTNSQTVAKCIWSACVEQHHFSLEAIKMKPIRFELESLFKELDDCLNARMQGHWIGTFQAERFDYMTGVVVHLKAKKSLLDGLMKDKMNMVKQLEDQETAITKMTPASVQDFEKDSIVQWENCLLSYDHYEANKTLDALEEIFSMEQKVTVGFYKLVSLYNSATAKLIKKMMALQMTKIGKMKVSEMDLKKNWIEWYKTSLTKLKDIERRVNRYRKVLNMPCVDFASRYEDHKVTKTPVSASQKQMLCRCADHSHKVLHQQCPGETTKTEPKTAESVATYKTSESKSTSSSTSLRSQTASRDHPPPRLHTKPPQIQSASAQGKPTPSPSVVSTTGSMSSSSSSSRPYLISNSDSSSSSALSSPFILEPKQSDPTSKRRVRDDQGVFEYPQPKQRPIVKNHTCDDLGGRSSRVVRDVEGLGSGTLDVRGAGEGYDSRSIRSLSKRYSYKMALEPSSSLDEELADDDNYDDDNLYNVSMSRVTHVLTRSSSTHQTSVSHHHQHHLPPHHQHQQQHHHYHFDQYINQRLHAQQFYDHCVLREQTFKYDRCSSRGRVASAGCYPTADQAHPFGYPPHNFPPGSAMQTSFTSRCQHFPTWGEEPHLGHSRKHSETVQGADRKDPRSFPGYGKFEGSKEHVYQRIPSDEVKSRKSSFPLPGSLGKVADSNFSSCFSKQRKYSESHAGEPSSPLSPGCERRRGTVFYNTPPGLQKSFIATTGVDLSLYRNHRNDEPLSNPIKAADKSKNVSAPYDSTHHLDTHNNGLVSTSLLFDTSELLQDSCLKDNSHHLPEEDFNVCMRYFDDYRTRNYYAPHGRRRPSSSRPEDSTQHLQPQTCRHFQQGHDLHCLQQPAIKQTFFISDAAYPRPHQIPSQPRQCDLVTPQSAGQSESRPEHRRQHAVHPKHQSLPQPSQQNGQPAARAERGQMPRGHRGDEDLHLFRHARNAHQPNRRSKSVQGRGFEFAPRKTDSSDQYRH